MSFLVVRLVPKAPVNGATFATYLDGLALQGSDLYEVKSNGVNYDAVERFTKK